MGHAVVFSRDLPETHTFSLLQLGGDGELCYGGGGSVVEVGASNSICTVGSYLISLSESNFEV